MSGSLGRPSVLALGVVAVLFSLPGCEAPLKPGRVFLPDVLPAKPPGPPPSVALQGVWPPRAVWVPRAAYRDPSQIAALMEDCRQAGLNVVLFQVRGSGTALYHSSIEPFATELYTGAPPPNFDPLEVACREAHARGIALHAWVNVMPAWRGATPPADRRQLYHAHPEWFWYDQQGRRQPLGSFYVSLNPCLPEVRQYLVNVFEEILRRYPVDGLHLDYIRFPSEQAPRGSDYPHDRTTLALYRQATGRAPRDSRAIWTQWRTQQVSELVRQIRIMKNRTRPAARLTAACGPNFQRWRADHFQDGPTWLRLKYVDAVFLMNYTQNLKAFERAQTEWAREVPGAMIVPGLGVHDHDSDAVTLEQLRLAREWGAGFALFSSNSLFGPLERNQRRLKAIRPMLLNMQARAPI